ncbi:MFS transporter [soil metagenome]
MPTRPSPGEPSLEDAEDALVDGDRTFAPGTARAALANPTFRKVYFGAFASNIGTWMQNVVLAALAYDLTGSSVFVGIITFAQLGPLLLLSVVGGALADLIDRRRLLIIVAFEQLAFSLILALLVRPEEPPKVALVAVVFAIGAGQAVFAPTYTAMLPSLVGRENLSGAIALNSAQMNGSRVIGPAIGGIAFAAVGASWVFAGNALTYLFIVGAMLAVRLPETAYPAPGGQGWRRLASGFGIARRDQVVRRCLITISTFSLFSLVFVTQLAVLAADNLGISPRSSAYGALYACFGLGAVAGALSIGTVFASRSKPAIVRAGLIAFAATLTAFAVLRQPAPAFPVAVLVGFCYFATTTSLSTVLQEQLDEAVRGRVMALWIMGFGGIVPIGSLLAGPVIDATSITTVVLFGAACALGLSFYARVDEPDVALRAG